MKSIDLSPLYRDSIGYDRLASLLDTALRTDSIAPGYPPYNIEALDDTRYAITLALAGFDKRNLSISVENGVLTVSGEAATDEENRYLHRGIAPRAFEHRFNLADYVEVTDANFSNGLLTISLVKEIPEAMKPKKIAISGSNTDGRSSDSKVLEHEGEQKSPASSERAA